MPGACVPDISFFKICNCLIKYNYLIYPFPKSRQSKGYSKVQALYDRKCLGQFIGFLNLFAAWDVQHTGSQGQLKDLFSQFGKVSEVTVPKNKATNSTKGFAFVLYENGIHADRYVIYCTMLRTRSMLMTRWLLSPLDSLGSADLAASFYYRPDVSYKFEVFCH